MAWETRTLAERYDLLAPDGSEIRLLTSVRGGSMVHCTVPPGQVTAAVEHHTVEEVWYCVAGRGQVWRRDAGGEEIVDVRAGMALNIPLGVAFQFRTTGDQPFQVIITTIPPWPGPDEALPVTGAW